MADKKTVRHSKLLLQNPLSFPLHIPDSSTDTAIVLDGQNRDENWHKERHKADKNKNLLKLKEGLKPLSHR